MLPTMSLLRQYDAFDTKDLRHADTWSKLADHINSEYDTLIKYRALPLIELVQNSEPYANLEEMQADYRRKRLKVSELHCEHPSFSRKTNLRFRILHDIVHCVINADFSEQGEYETFVHQSHGLTQELQRALYTEIVIQAAYKIHRGEFPEQKLFIKGGFMIRTMCAECFATLRRTSVQPRKALSVAHDGDRCTGCTRQSDYVVGYFDAARGEWRIEQW